MLDGVLQQCDTPQKLFHRPANLFVAAFMGSPAMNVVEAEVADGQVTFAGLTVPLAAGVTARRRHAATVILGIRPTDLRHPREAPAGPPADQGAPGRDRGARRPLESPLPARGAPRHRPTRRGPRSRPRATTTPRCWRTTSGPDSAPRSTGGGEVRLGEEIELAVDHQYLHFFDPASGLAITSADGAAAARAAPQPRRYRRAAAARGRARCPRASAPPRSPRRRSRSACRTARVAYSTAQRSLSAGSAPRRSAQM